MFLHSGASLHGHEYSTRPHHNTAAPRHTIPFLRSALRPLTDAESNVKISTSTPTPTPPPARTRTRTHRPLSFAETPSTPSPEPWNVRRPRPTSECFTKREHVVRFAEPAVEKEPDPKAVEPLAVQVPMERGCTPSEDEGVYSEASDTNGSLASSGKRKKRRTPRSGTKFILAQPPPKVVKRHRRFIQIKPKLVLQLQQLTETRPKPAFDVLPSAVLSGSVIAAPRLVRRFPRLFTSRGELGANDLILAKSEDYDAEDDLDGGEASLGKRELIAVISPRIIQGDNRTDIVLADGSVWTASHMPSGSYEFVCEDAEGKTRTARWVKRRLPLEEEDDYKFTFSILDPSSRRHPIMATLTPTTLEILDHYTTVSPSSSSKYPPSRPFPFEAKGTSPLAAEQRSERMTLPVDETTRTFITVSSVFVSLHLIAIAAQKPPAASTPGPSAGHNRTFSVQDRRISFPLASSPMDSPRPAISPIPTPVPNDRHAVDPMTPAATAACSPLPHPTPVKRASSTGAAFMQRRRTAALERQATESVETGDEGPGLGIMIGGTVRRGTVPGTKGGLYSMIKKAFRRAPREVGG